jgi:hypothetical protein
MRRDFVTTRVVLAVAVVVSVVWLVLESDNHHRPAAPPASSLRSLAQATFVPDLADTGVQALWQERRRQLADLARALDAEPDSSRADSLRREIEELITRTERDVERRLREPAPSP